MALNPRVWKVPLLLLLMSVLGSAAMLVCIYLLQNHWGPLSRSAPPAEREAIQFISYVECLGLFFCSILGGGALVARLLRLGEDSTRLEAVHGFWSALLGIPAGALLLYYRFGEAATARLGSMERWGMIALGAYLILSGAAGARKAWRLRREIGAFYR